MKKKTKPFNKLDSQLAWMVEDAKTALWDQHNAHHDLQAKTALEIEKIIRLAFYKGMEEGIADVAKRLNVDLKDKDDDKFKGFRNCGSLTREYDIYRGCADDGKGGDITRNGQPLLTYDEWLDA